MTNRIVVLIVAAALILPLAIISCGGKTSLSNLSARELMDRGMDKYRQEKYLDAISSFQTVVFNHPGEAMVDTAQYYLALSYYGNSEYAVAAAEFNRLVVNYPASPFAPLSQLMKAVCTYEGTPDHYGLDQSNLTDAIQQFEDYIIDYPESDSIDVARRFLQKARTRMAHKHYNAGVVYTRINALNAAKIYFQLVVDDYTDTEYAPLATYGLAEIAYKRHNYDEAQSAFDKFITVFSGHELVPDARELACKSAYLSAKDLLEKGDTTAAIGKLSAMSTSCDIPDWVEKAGERLREIGNVAAPDALQASGGQ